MATNSKRDALMSAIRHFAALEQSYRNPRGEPARRMSKQNRQEMAAQYAQWQRDLAAMLDATPTTDREG